MPFASDDPGHRRAGLARWSIALAGIALAAAALFWFRGRDRSLGRVLESGSITLGYAVEAPYAYVTGDGAVTGEFPETARLIAGRLGIERVRWRQAEFGTLIDELIAGRIDVVAVGMFITEERAAKVAFSLPWIQARQALLVPRGNPRNLQSYAAASASEVRVAFVAGATEEDLLRKSGLPAERLLAVPDALAGRIAVESGAADALALSAPTIRLMERERDLGRTEAASQFEQPPREITAGMGLAAFAFRKEDRRLREAWNAELMKLRGSAEQRRLLLRFGFTEEEAAGASAPRTKR